MGRLVSVNVGLPRDFEWKGETVHTAIWKQPISGRRMVRRLNIDGDGQGDLAGHGGEHRAVMVYQLDSYRYWEAHLGRSDFSSGQFGENFTVEGLPDHEVCIGDRSRIGDAIFEVTQPRVTCYRVGIRMSDPAIPHFARLSPPAWLLPSSAAGRRGRRGRRNHQDRGRTRAPLASQRSTPYFICRAARTSSSRALCGSRP